MKKINKLIRNQAGMNLLSVLGTMAVLGAGLVGVVNLIKMSDTGQDSASRKVEATSLTSMIETKLKSVFLNTQDIDGKPTSGLCEMVRVNNSNSELSNVYLQLPNPNTTDLFTAAVWAKAFPEFTPVLSGQEGCNLTSKYGRCYKLNPSSASNFGAAKEILIKLNPIFEINIKTMLTNPAAETTFGEVVGDGMKKYDFKAISFQYTIRTIYKSKAGENNSNIGNRLIKSFVWAGDVGICQVSDKKISLTGSSLGDLSGLTTFNLPGFSTDSLITNNNSPLDVSFNKSQIRSGKQTDDLANDSQFLKTRDADGTVEHGPYGPVYSACNENVYQCPQLVSDQTRNYQAMRHLLTARYNSPNILANSGTSAQIAPRIKFKKLDGQAIQANYYETFKILDQNYVKGTGNDNWFYQNGNTEKPLLIGASQSIEPRLVDSKGTESSNNVCRKVCVSSTQFNTAANHNYNSIFSYKVKVSNPSPSQVTEFELNGGPVACTACYMKNCDQFGLGTFGPMEDQPTEALDSGVPTCVQHESHANNFYEMPSPDLGQDSGNKCISARLKTDDLEGFSLTAESCVNPKPVLCFAFGKHLIAKNIVSLTSSSIITSKFDDANDVCFGLGKESIKKLPFWTLLSQQGNLGADEMKLLDISSPQAVIPKNARVDVVNYITQGSFFAPVGENQEKMLRAFAGRANGDKQQLIDSNFWIGLKTDNLGYIYSPAPQLSALSLSENVKWGIHYNGDGKMIVKKLSNSLNISNSDSSPLLNGAKVGLLYHHERFKGVNFGPSLKPYGDNKLRALCRKRNYPHELFVSDSKTDSFLEAENVCKNEGGLFLPPLTTAGWEVAYQKVNSDDSKHPFPVAADADNVADTDNAVDAANAAWVNVIQKGNSKSIHLSLLDTTPSKFMNNQGEFVQEEALAEGETKSPQEKESYEWACFNKDKGEIRIRKSCDSGSRRLSRDEIIAASSSENIYLRFMLKAALANNSGSGLVKLYDAE